MSFSEYKPEPFLKQMCRMWRENKGNWLLGVGVMVSLLGWLVGYFDLIPVINAVERSPFQVSPMGGSTLTVEITGCASDDGKVIAMLYDGRGFSDASIPLRLVALTVEDRKAVWEVHNISYGSYAIYAFQDLDGNEEVDPKKERQGLSIDEAEAASGTLNLSNASFDFTPERKRITIELRGGV